MVGMREAVLGFVVVCVLAGSVGVAEVPYNFRTSEAYRKLSGKDRKRLERVHRDLMMLWGALDRYADHHDGNPPETLEKLVPHYLAELPTDPFATDETARQKGAKPYRVSKDGRGYHYRKGAPGNRAWCLASAGLPDFPYLAARGNIGLYVCKGTWISGRNPLILKEKK
jgi:hypothetical protein